jgi:hypothetical protein
LFIHKHLFQVPAFQPDSSGISVLDIILQVCGAVQGDLGLLAVRGGLHGTVVADTPYYEMKVLISVLCSAVWIDGIEELDVMVPI